MNVLLLLPVAVVDAHAPQYRDILHGSHSSGLSSSTRGGGSVMVAESTSTA